MSRSTVPLLAERPAFPRAVARLGRARVWYASDIEAYRDGRPFPERREGELQDQLVTIHEIAECTGIAASSVRTHISEGRFYLAPPRDGRADEKQLLVPGLVRGVAATSTCRDSAAAAATGAAAPADPTSRRLRSLGIPAVSDPRRVHRRYPPRVAPDILASSSARPPCAGPASDTE